MKYSSLFTIKLFAIGLFLLSSCHSSKKEKMKIDQGFKEYISAFSAGQISSRGSIVVKLSQQYQQDVETNVEILENPFSFQPTIKGKCYWKDNRTLTFVPDQALISGTVYKGAFQLKQFVDVGLQHKSFPLQFQVIKQAFQVQEGELKPSKQNPTSYDYTCLIVTADVMEGADCESLIGVQAEGQNPEIVWQHNKLSNKHTFTIKNIERKEEDSHLLVSWDGTSQGLNIKGKEEINIPGLNNFSLVNAQVFHQPNQYILITFSDPLKKPQDLKGLIRIKDSNILRYIIENNQVKVFPNKRETGSKKVYVEKGITNASGYKLKQQTTKVLTFEASKPNVRLLGKGVIIPETEGLHFPFEAINLKAVDVSIVKIYENNISQFLQDNNLDEERNIRRVGRLIMKKRVDLVSDNIIDYGKWNAFSLDLKELLQSDPAAMYQIRLSFNKSYSLYPCTNDVEEDNALEEVKWDEEYSQEQSYWDFGAYYYNYDEYNWKDRDNPCTPSYYRNKEVRRNVLASNIGIIAKVGSTKELNITVSDIISARPLSGVAVDILDYQQQITNTGTTNSKGQLSLSFDHRPYLLVAKNDKQMGYLKLGDGLSLSLSKFDVGGTRVEKGLKGFIYGERGVWRPGDDIYLTFILEDKEKTLPDAHPIVFELINPQGKTVDTQITTKCIGGFCHFKTKTKEDAITGNWTAKVKVGGAQFYKRIKVETVKPNRLKINLTFSEKMIVKNADELRGDLEVKWLHGAIAKNLKADIYMDLNRIKTQFETHKDYIFDDPTVEFSSFEKKIYDGKVDGQGRAKFAVKFDLKKKLPGMLMAKFNTKAYEQGGNFSINQESIPYAPYTTYVGIKTPKGDKARGMLLTDEKHKIEVVTLNAKGEKVSQENLVAKLYKIQWRWWWQAGSDNIGSYIRRRNLQPILTRKFSTKEGYGSFLIEVKSPDWGRYLLKVETSEGHSAAKTLYIDWPGWASRAQSDNPGGASMLLFNADKKKYNVGENVKVSFPSSAGARALVSIEKGSKVLSSYWIDTQNDQTVFEFVVSEEMTPNIYVNITLLQPYEQLDNDLPLRLYGVIPILVEDPTTRLFPVIEMKDELKPESKVDIKVSEKNGEAMTFTLALVDDGLLDLTNYKTPNPWTAFYAREALGVKTWDLYDYVLGAYGAKIEAAFAIGGDGELLNNKDRKAQRFRPVVKYFGPCHLKAGKSKVLSFTMPRYIGSVRTMVIAGNEKAYGHTEKTTPVKNPLMLLATLPRVISPEEELDLPVTLFALNEDVKDVNVRLEVNENIIIQDKAVKKIGFDAPGEKDFSYKIKVGEELGIGKVSLHAKSGDFEASYEIEIQVRAPNPQKTVTYSKMLKAGEEWTQAYTAFGIQGSNTATIEVSGMPSLNLDRRLKYLMRYPYGCVEQTVSAVFPQLYLPKLKTLSSEETIRISQNVKSGIQRLQSFQTSDGGFSYWPGKSRSNLWGTNYAGHFMIEAEDNGFTLPVGLKTAWLGFQTEKANSWMPSSEIYSSSCLMQAYRLYTLALSGHANLGAMNRLKEVDAISLEASFLLAAAYSIIGNKEVAMLLIQNPKLPKRDMSYDYYTYGSYTRNTAIVLECLLDMDQLDKAMPLLKELSDKLNAPNWLSTQTTAYCLKAMAKATKMFDAHVDQFWYTYAFDGQKAKDEMLTKVVKQHTITHVGAQNQHQVVLKNASSSPFYANLTIDGIPLVDSLDSQQDNLELQVVYKDLDDNIIDPKRIHQGTDFKVELSVTHPGILTRYKDLALTMLVPSGWEIINTRLNGDAARYRADVPEYLDIRDDRVSLFFDLNKKEKKTFVILLNASYEGRFYLPAVQCSEMYNNNIKARVKGGMAEVYKTEK